VLKNLRPSHKHKELAASYCWQFIHFLTNESEIWLLFGWKIFCKQPF